MKNTITSMKYLEDNGLFKLRTDDWKIVWGNIVSALNDEKNKSNKKWALKEINSIIEKQEFNKEEVMKKLLENWLTEDKIREIFDEIEEKYWDNNLDWIVELTKNKIENNI